MQAPQSNTAAEEASSTPSFLASIRAAAMAQQQNSETPEALISSAAHDHTHGLPDIDRAHADQESTSTAGERNRGPMLRTEDGPPLGYLGKLPASRYAKGNNPITTSLAQSSYSASLVGAHAFPPAVLNRLIQSANAEQLRHKEASSTAPLQNRSERFVASFGPQRLESSNQSPISIRQPEFAYPTLNHDDRDHGENNSPSVRPESSSAAHSERRCNPPYSATGAIEEYRTVPKVAQPSLNRQDPGQELQRGQEQRQRDQLTCAGLAHDAKNLLSALKLYSDLLALPEVLPERHRHYASELRSLAERSETLIEDLIACRISADAPSSHQINSPIGAAQATMPAKSSVAESLSECGGLLKALARGRLEIIFDPQADLTVPISSDSLERILVNLVNNATAATMHRGAIRIRVGERSDSLTASKSKSPDTTVLTVDDSGCGMTEEQLCALETPGTFLHEQRHGIGMQVVRSLVKASHGTLTVQSRIGVGTHVEICWPIVKQNQAAQASWERAQMMHPDQPIPGVVHRMQMEIDPLPQPHSNISPPRETDSKNTLTDGIYRPFAENRRSSGGLASFDAGTGGAGRFSLHEARLPQTLDLSSSTAQTMRAPHMAPAPQPANLGKGAIAC